MKKFMMFAVAVVGMATFGMASSAEAGHGPGNNWGHNHGPNHGPYGHHHGGYRGPVYGGPVYGRPVYGPPVYRPYPIYTGSPYYINQGPSFGISTPGFGLYVR
ncbi:hypothetical protein SH661x_000070 [Planctomicrobium sp. SH661]|uniref:hypothetical protein n=1 Tax=Planctomicrobium sp. SH661 TaxID=3448124 RepID=UPI003F5BD164